MDTRYHVLVVDPPWNQGKTGLRATRPYQGKNLDYPTMQKEELEQLPIRAWALEQAFLWLWATNSKDRKTGEPILSMAFDLLTQWGFTYYTMITWNKKTGPCPFRSLPDHDRTYPLWLSRESPVSEAFSRKVTDLLY